MSINTIEKDDLARRFVSIASDEAMKAKEAEQKEIEIRKAEYVARGGKVHVISLGYTTIRMEEISQTHAQRRKKDK